MSAQAARPRVRSDLGRPNTMRHFSSWASSQVDRLRVEADRLEQLAKAEAAITIPAERRVNVPAAASIIGCTKSRVWALVASGRLVVERWIDGKSWIIDRRSIDKYQATKRKCVRTVKRGIRTRQV